MKNKLLTFSIVILLTISLLTIFPSVSAVGNTPPRFKTLWIEVAGQFGDEQHIYSLTVYNGSLFGGTGQNGKLYKWNDVNSWIEVAGKLGNEERIYSLAVYNGSLYGGTRLNGKLYKWNDVDSWIEVAGKLGNEEVIYSLAVYDGNLYGGTCCNGKLYKWNDVDSWIEVASLFGGEQYIYSLAVYNGSLYGGSAFGGKLFKWNDVDSWIEVAGKLGDEPVIHSLAVYDGNLYGGTGQNGKLYKWNDVNSWIEVAGKLGDEGSIRSLAVYDGNLYGGTCCNGKLYKWNDVDSWIEVAGKLGNEQYIYSLAVYNGSLFGGTAFDGSLFKFSQYSSPIHNSINISIDTTLKINVSDANSDTMSVSFYWDDDTLIETITDVSSNTSGETSSLSLNYNTSYSWYAIANDSLSQTQSDGFSFTTIPMPNFPPVKPSCISPLNNSIDISITTTLKVHVADINNDTMNVSFYFIEGIPSYISYTGNNISEGDYIQAFPCGIRLSPTELIGYDGKYLTGVMTYEIDEVGYEMDGDYTIEIYADGNETNPRTLTTSQIVAYTDIGWKEIMLDNPVLINDTHHIWILLTGNFSAGLDEGCTSSGKSDLIYYNDAWIKLFDNFGFDNDIMIKARIGGFLTPITTIPDVINNTDVETSNLLLEYNTSYDWYAVADDSLLRTQSDIFTFTTGENTIPSCEHAIPRVESDGYLYMIYRDGNINVSNLNLLMGSYTPFSVWKFNYTSQDWDSNDFTINSNDYIKIKINQSDMPYSDTLISIIPQIRFNISDAENDKLNITVNSNSSGSWEIVKQWLNVSQGWFVCEDSNIDEYNTTYYYSIDVTDSYNNNLISDFSFVTTSTEPAIPPIIAGCKMYILTAILVLIAIGGSIYILSPKKRKR